MTEPESPDKAVLELYKLEYTKAAERFDNIYRSAWTIFSYMVAVSGAILAFGGDRLEQHAVVAVACLPLVFWFWSTYLPLDRYGNQTVQRLKVLEDTLNEKFGVRMEHFSKFARDLSLRRGFLKKYHGKRNDGFWRAIWAGMVCQLPRARFAIWVFFLFLHGIAVCETTLWLQSGEPLLIRKHSSDASPRYQFETNIQVAPWQEPVAPTANRAAQQLTRKR